MKKLLFFSVFAAATLILSCGGNSETENKTEANQTSEEPKSMVNTSDPNSYDPKRGEGKFSPENVTLGATVDEAMAKKGDEAQGVKCASCHKLTDEKLVGPGWKGVTQRRAPHWIMNFITNPDPMIDKDPEVQAQLEICLVRMPNQSLTDDEARGILEFMRKNDQ